MNIATSELEHLREEVKNCHRIIKDLQKKREFVGLFDEEIEELFQTAAGADEEVHIRFARAIESKLKEVNI